jgi:4-carboxymuconolactone decarboxylase
MTCGSTKTIVRLLAGTFVFGLVFGTFASAQDRMPPIPDDKLTPAQKKTVDEYKKARGGEPGGPWAVLTRSPELMSRTLMLSDYLRFNSTLSPRLSEFVILMTAREWGQNYEWNAHHPLAVKGGLNPEVAKAVAEGRRSAAASSKVMRPTLADTHPRTPLCAELYSVGKCSGAMLTELS